MSGKRATAGCGHPGEHVTANYIQCLTPGCDGLPSKGVPIAVDNDKTPPLERCSKCGSDQIAAYYYFGTNLRHCIPCGAVFP